MSFQTWMEEFYPNPLPSNVKSISMTLKQACQHSLQKWIGLRPENLKKHHVILLKMSLGIWAIDEIFSKEISLSSIKHKLKISGESCALCFISEIMAIDINEWIDEWIDEKKTRSVSVCEVCPLNFTLSYPCDGNIEDQSLKHRSKHKLVSPFGIFLETKNPESMIKALEDTLKMIQENPKDFLSYIVSKKKIHTQRDYFPPNTEYFKVDINRFLSLERERIEKSMKVYLNRIENAKGDLNRTYLQNNIEKYQKIVDRLRVKLDNIKDIG